jgi:hypothetical protein
MILRNANYSLLDTTLHSRDQQDCKTRFIVEDGVQKRAPEVHERTVFLGERQRAVGERA